MRSGVVDAVSSATATASSKDRAVDVFADLHTRGRTPTSGWYRSRIPAVKPGAGEQYAFEVDLDTCTGCKACVVACHSMNGLDEGELWRAVGLLESVRPAAPEQRTVTTACHHCGDPACLNGCPVNAYEKDVLTGVVVHLDDQCIGCSYCTMMCPYEVPVFNERLGIVRKCDMCHGRLAAGEAPACVQGCPNAAIRITITDSAGHNNGSLVPGAPSSSITRPTTRYITTAPEMQTLALGLSSARQADLSANVAPGHQPLVAMLLLLQVGAGVALVDRSGSLAWLTVILGFGGAALSLLHLGRPLYAWRVVLGVGHSWLSREAASIGVFVSAAILHLLVRTAWSWLIVSTAGVGVTFASVRVYSETRRVLWNLGRTGGWFGVVVVSSALVTHGLTHNGNRLWAALPLFGTLVVVAIIDATRPWRYLRSGIPTLVRTGSLLSDQLRGWHRLQVGAALGGVVASAVWMLFGDLGALCVLAGPLALSFVAQRLLFFRSVSPDRMPR